MYYELVKTDGTIMQRSKLSLEEMQQFVGGYIELTHLPGVKAEIFVNEEGLLKNLPQNPVYPFFVGNVILKYKGKMRRA